MQVNVPDGFAAGTWQYVQLITPQITATDPAGVGWHLNMNGSTTVLDTAVPYPYQNNAPGGVGNTQAATLKVTGVNAGGGITGIAVNSGGSYTQALPIPQG